LVDAPDGSWWFYHFQDTPELGRVVHLQPARWLDEWPLMGVDKDGNGIGEPVGTWQKPIASEGRSLPQTDDEFSGTLGLQWQWNHNPRDGYWSLAERKGWLTLHALPADGLRSCHNMLTQKVMGYVTESTTVVEARGNCYAGLACIGREFRGVGVTPEGIVVEHDNKRTLVRRGKFKRVYLRVQNDCIHHSHRFFYSLDGRTFIPATEPFDMHNGNWKGIRVGLFCYGDKGLSRFDKFYRESSKY
jgi:beta-xylosidase